MSLLTRRHLLRLGGVAALSLLGLDRRLAAGDGVLAPRLPRLIVDPQGILDLPEGFTYRVLSRSGSTMTDGLLLPGAMDGMACFALADGTWALVRNHEISLQGPGAFGPDYALAATIDRTRLYDNGDGITPGLGGTTTVVLDPPSMTVRREFLSLGGTYRNCAGGPTPWGSWVTCEEDCTSPGHTSDGVTSKAHGYPFEVPANATGLVPAVPLLAMGRFRREAIAVDRSSGCVYQTEDDRNGVFYRFIPKVLGNLAAGGRLQAAKLIGYTGADTTNWEARRIAVGQTFAVEWRDIDNPAHEPARQAVATGCPTFTRGEGCWAGVGAIWFACTDGGSQRKGQVWRYAPSPVEGRAGETTEPGRLTLFCEPDDGAVLENVDNVVTCPFGGLIACEDNASKNASPENRMVWIAADASCQVFAVNRLNESELAGACFSPDGRWLFVNIQSPGLTLAITGPWPA